MADTNAKLEEIEQEVVEITSTIVNGVETIEATYRKPRAVRGLQVDL